MSSGVVTSQGDIMSSTSSSQQYLDGFDAAMNIYENKICSKCKHGKTSGDFIVCDLGVRMSKVWGNSHSFGCTKWSRKDEKKK